MDIPDLNMLFDAGSPYFTHLSAAILIVILFLLFLALLSTAGYFPVLLSITSYTSVVARLKAKGVPFIEPEQVQDLLQSSSVQDCLGRLKSMGYLTGVSADITAEQAEEELLVTWFEEVALLRSQAPSASWQFFDTVLFFQEISKVKRLIRLIHLNRAFVIADNPDLWPAGFSPDLAAKLGNAGTMSEAVRLLQETRYGEALLGGLAFYEKENSVFYLDHALDCMGFSE
uniref:V0D/AC39 family V-type ATPase subunit n=1 Tax=Methanospirillum sp. TaxID=45200 RepID=UPI001BD60903